MPCDTGSSRGDLEKVELFKGLDFSGLPEDWTSKVLYVPPSSLGGNARTNCYWKGKWAPDPHSLIERARTVRK